MSPLWRFLLTGFFLALALPGSAQAAEPDADYVLAPERSQGGIGKFYMGREISGVMGHQAADWLERPQRSHEEMPDEVVARMDLQPDDVVADIGAGSGYFTFRIAPQLPRGKVVATDIQPEMLQMIEQRMRREQVENVELVQGGIDDPGLAPNSIDVALMVDVYHELSHPYEMMQGVYEALKPGGRVILIEYRGEDPSVPIRPLHKMTEQQVVKEMGAFDLYWEDTLDFLPWQHMMVFSKSDR